MKNYTDNNWLKDAYINRELSIKDISLICNVSIGLIHRYLIRFNIPCRPAKCPIGAKSGQWKGGRTKTKAGYIWIHVSEPHIRKVSKKHRYVPEQILIMEKHLSRLLNKEETVHHINEIRNDNRIENLYLFPSINEHQSYHQKFRRGTTVPIVESNLF